MKNITYTAIAAYLDNKTMYQPVCWGKLIALPYYTRQGALKHARRAAEAIRQDYIERGIRARTIEI